MNEAVRSLACSLARSFNEMPVYAYEEYTLANNAKPINFQFQQARIADRVCAPLGRHSRPLPTHSFRARRPDNYPQSETYLQFSERIKHGREIDLL